MGSKLKKIGLWVVGLFVGFILLLVILGSVFGNKIEQRIITEINKQLEVEVSVNGPIKLSLFKHFPQASLAFNDVYISGSSGIDTAALMEVSHLYLTFDLRSILTKNYKLETLILKDGKLNLERYPDGSVNYEITKPSTDTSSTEDAKFSLSLTKAVLENIEIRYNDGFNGDFIHTLVNEATFSGKFSEEQFTLNTELDADFRQLYLDEVSYLQDRNVSLEGKFEVNQPNSTYSFQGLELNIDKTFFTANGSFVNGTERYADMSISAEGTDLEDLINLLPAQLREKFNASSGKGQYTIQASIKGPISGGYTPDIIADVNLRNGALSNKQVKHGLKNVAFDLHYEMTDNNPSTGYVKIAGFKSTYRDEPLFLDLLVKDFNNPTFDLQLDGIFDLESVTYLLTDDELSKASGKINISNFSLSGNAKDFKQLNQSNFKGNGRLVLDDLQFTFNGVDYDEIFAQMDFTESEIDAKGLTLEFLDTDIAFDGKLQGLLEYIFSLTDDVENNTSPLRLNGKLYSKRIDLNKMMEGFSSEENEEIESQGQMVSLKDVFSWRGRLEATIDELLVQDIELTDIHTEWVLSPGDLQIDKLDMLAFDGDLEAIGIISFKKDNTILMRGNVEAHKLDLKECFKQFGDFEQETLTHKHISGTFNADISFTAVWNNISQFSEDDLFVNANVELLEGELKNFTPLESLSGFIDVDELKEVKFSTLRNTIEIENRMIKLPQMEIETNVLDLFLSGNHSFDNQIDYHVQVGLGDVLAKKFKSKKTSDEYLEAESKMYLFILMTGTADNPIIKYDKEASKEKRQQDWEEEKEELKNIFKKGPEYTIDEDPHDSKYYQIDDDPEFIDWGDEDDSEL